MSNYLGKRISSNGNSSSIDPAGVCTWACPPVCEEICYRYCGCSANNYDARIDKPYYANYNKMITNYRTPDLN